MGCNTCFGAASGDQVFKDNSNWMTNLPQELHSVPLTKLCIPGSHDSFTDTLKTDMGIANDQPEWLRKLDSPLVRKIVYNWSVTQKLSLTQQLHAGVRYFDFRVSVPDKQPEQTRFLHGLYGAEILDLLLGFIEFIGNHPKEVVLLDFNHFYHFNPQNHASLLALISDLFDSKLCPYNPNLKEITLNFLWEKGYQLIVFYQCNVPNLPRTFWPKASIQSPYADKDSVKAVIKFLEETLDKREADPMHFYVAQGIATPRTQDILKHAAGSLEKDLAGPTTYQVAVWLRSNWQRLKPKLNIFICDFVEKDAFCGLIISINGSPKFAELEMDLD